MKNLILSTQSPAEMPQSVKSALIKIWTKIPDNIADICYSYGNICFTPRELTRDLVVHESTHTEQQAKIGGADLWWEKYGDDKEFRYQQEVEAYRAQYQYIIATLGKRKAFKYAERFAKEMSAPMYGDMCSYNRALADILIK